MGSAQDVAKSLEKYRALGIDTFVLSDTPYLDEIRRQGRQLLPLLGSVAADATAKRAEPEPVG